MQDFYLQFESEDQAKTVLFEVVETEGSDVQYLPKFSNIDQIGIIYQETESGEFQARDGWFVNVRVLQSENSSFLEKFRVYPSKPVRVWG